MKSCLDAGGGAVVETGGSSSLLRGRGFSLAGEAFAGISMGVIESTGSSLSGPAISPLVLFTRDVLKSGTSILTLSLCSPMI